ncbi:MAG: GNAT family N-acetyltransferase [Candidatus Binatia bacterium]
MTSDRSGSDWIIRGAQPHELPVLADLERRAGARFNSIPALADLPEVLAPPEALAAAITRDQLWVAVTGADSTLVGFTYADVIDGAVHLEELDVLPEWGRHGIGSALVDAVVGDARNRGLPAVTLTTFRDVPWNAPFYARLGFTIVDLVELGPGLRAIWTHERERGLPPALRVVMRRALAR